jgi:RNA-directed DNA polymerase
MSASETHAYEWESLPWKKFQKTTLKLQKRIYRASQRGDASMVRRLEKLLIKSQAARFLAVRRVAQENRGKNTAGVDGVRSLTPPQRLALAAQLKTEPYQRKARPVRRVWIPKRTGDEKRPLGIPTMAERARQALAKLALEPEWEAKFEPNSYGFRPGRSAHDAVSYIYTCIRAMPKCVLDADIAKCFDRINHAALLEKLDTYPQMRRSIKAWLNAGILDGQTLFPSEEGTPQGGVISPLLANVALHGMETFLQAQFDKTKRIRSNPNTRVHWQPQVVRYADDFVVLHPDPAVIEEIKALVSEWLRPLGLELSEKKTRITHTLWRGGETAGFDFLGFHIRQYRVGKHRQPPARYGRLPFTTRVTPSKRALREQSAKLRQTIRSMRARPQEDLIHALNPMISGWGRYFGICYAESKGTLDHHMLFFALKRWARRRHPNKHWGWVARKYWRLETGKWRFGAPDGITLQSHYQKVERLKPVGRRSPFDGDWSYWLMRGKQHPGLTPTMAKLYRAQQGRCTGCGRQFHAEDLMVVSLQSRTSGEDERSRPSRLLLHRHCREERYRYQRPELRGAGCGETCTSSSEDQWQE